MFKTQLSPLEHGRNRITSQLLAGLGDGAELLDYGCGQARFAVALATELGLAVHACDIDARLVSELDDRYGENVDFFVLPDGQPKLPFTDGQLAAVTCCDVLEHMPDGLRMQSLEEMRRVVAADGRLVVTVPHAGLFAFADPENVKFRFPRLHRGVFTAIKGREKYQASYGGERFGNFSEQAERHVHFSAGEIARAIEAGGFCVQEVRYFTLIAPLIGTALWAVEAFVRRVPRLRPLGQLCWKIYVWDSDLEPGRIGGSIAIRATPRPLSTRTR